MHKQDRTNGREFKNGTTGASVGHYFPRWGECGMVARTDVKFCRQSVSFCLFPLFSYVTFSPIPHLAPSVPTLDSSLTPTRSVF